MVAKEFNNLVTAQFAASGYGDLQDVDVEGEEETLSLCDLAANCSQDTEDCSWNDEFSKEEQSLCDEDFFEFFSKDFTASTHPKDSIIFCGKLIRYKEHVVPGQTQIRNTIDIVNQQQKLKKRILAWKSYSFDYKARTNSWKPQQRQEKVYKLPAVPKKYENDNDLSVKKVSTLGNPVKPRWYLFAFGYGRFPTEMELRDIKNRQKRRNNIPAATMFRSESTGCEKTNRHSQKRSSGRSLWRLLRVLCCKSLVSNVL